MQSNRSARRAAAPLLASFLLALTAGCGQSDPAGSAGDGAAPTADDAAGEEEATAAAPVRGIGIDGVGIDGLTGRSAVEMVDAVLADVAARDADYRAVLAFTDDALAEAARIDARRAAGEALGALAGIPVMVKDNIETRDAPTTAGAHALEGYRTGRDAPLVARLRDAGAVIVAKTNLSEWANFRSERSSSGWSGLGGQTRNAVAPDRTPCGSSSGSAVAVALGYVPLAIGTETNGSIVCPAAINGVVGFKPTHGLVPGAGVVPIAHTQDTAGPMARSVLDVAVGHAVLVDAPVAIVREDVAAGSLSGMRIGVVRSATGYHEGVDAVFERALGDLRAAGALIVDDLELVRPEGFGRDSYAVLLHEFRDDLDAWLANQDVPPPVDSLEAVIAFNEENAERTMPFFRQEILEAARDVEGTASEAYATALEHIRRATREEGLERLFAEYTLDAVVAPTEGPAWAIDRVNGDHFLGGFSTFPAVGGYPHLTLPMGRLHGLPLGLSIVGRREADVFVLGLGHAYESTRTLHEVGAPLD